ncbi:CAIB BAIF family enzyme [Fusarium denticulatum]|uniref:CAIB BAIF family enzyme n=1 Tax=Fusarium denticulatum TaxID=48507 RepID=A0A8H6CTC3_9HYPO|nr:CAIB BAIF family enzyme [Fusarium denticulatum]
MMPTPEQASRLSNIHIPNEDKASQSIDRKNYSSIDVLKEVWTGLGLPKTALTAIRLPGEEGPALPSSFKIGIIGQASIGLSALAAAQIHSIRNKAPVPTVRVPLEHAVVEYKCERLYTVSDELAPPSGGAIGGLHKTSDGYVRIHDGFPNHVQGTLDLLGLKSGATRQQVSEQTADWASIDLENCGTAEGKVAIYALRSYSQWDKLPQSRAIINFPISLKQVSKSSPTGLPSRMQPGNLKCLQGLRVVEMSRVIAAPLCGKTLAAHGAEVIWVTSPTLPDLPRVDREFGRGKKTVQLDIHIPEDRKQLFNLLKDCDVFIQGYRPGSLASHGLSQDELRSINPNIIVANMSAFGPESPWSGRRGFDSLVQTCSGMNVSEAEHAGKGEPARPTPCQALDHSGGYMLAVGVMAAVYHRAVEGGSWRVDVSLAGMMKYLRSLGQYPGHSGFKAKDFENPEDVPEEYFEVQETGFGTMKSIRHSATIEGLEVGWNIMPKPLGSDKPAWD